MGMWHLIFCLAVLDLAKAFEYYGASGPLFEHQWDIWRVKRDILVDCDRVAFVPETEDDSQYSEEVCTDTCEHICQDPKSLQDLAKCLGRMQLLSCQFGYTELRVVEAFQHWCVDTYQHLHMFPQNTTLWPSIKSEALQTKIYFDINATLDETCRDGAGSILEILDFSAADAAMLVDESIKCTGSLWSSSKRDTIIGHEAHLGVSVMDPAKIMFPLHPTLIDRFEELNGTMHWDFAMSACYQGALNPPPITQASWAGLVIEVEAPITSVRHLYNREEDKDFWSWKGPFVKW